MNFLQTPPGDDPLVVEGVFRAPVERVYKAWTEPERVVKWFGQNPPSLIAAEIDLRVGGSWRFVLSEAEERTACLCGEYVEVAPNSRLVFTWRHVVEKAGGDMDATPFSKVSVEFHAVEEGTRIHLRHEGIQSRDARLGVGGGWEASFAALGDTVQEA